MQDRASVDFLVFHCLRVARRQNANASFGRFPPERSFVHGRASGAAPGLPGAAQGAARAAQRAGGRCRGLRAGAAEVEGEAGGGQACVHSCQLMALGQLAFASASPQSAKLHCFGELAATGPSTFHKGRLCSSMRSPLHAVQVGQRQVPRLQGGESGVGGARRSAPA